MAEISIWEDTHLADELTYPVSAFVVSALSADIELYVFAESVKLRWEATVQLSEIDALERLIFDALPRLIFSTAAIPAPHRLRADTVVHYRFARDDAFTRLHLRDAEDHAAYRTLISEQGYAVDCLLYNVRHTAGRCWWYCFAIEADAYPELSIMLPLAAGIRITGALLAWILGVHAEQRFVRADAYAAPLAQALQRLVAQHDVRRPLPIA